MNEKPGLVLFSHGSLLCGSGEILRLHVERLAATGRYISVEAGYLNYCDPPVERAIEKCVDAGAATVIVVPYFLVAGKFVTKDLPPRLESAKKQFPGIQIRMARALENAPPMGAAIAEALTSAQRIDAWQRRAIDATKRQCELRTDCPLYGSPMCRAQKGMRGESR